MGNGRDIGNRAMEMGNLAIEIGDREMGIGNRGGAIIDSMSQLIVRKVPPRIVRALKQRAAQAGRSAEAEHRAILETVLAGGGSALDFKAFLLAAPDARSLRVRRSKDRGRRVRL